MNFTFEHRPKGRVKVGRGMVARWKEETEERKRNRGKMEQREIKKEKTTKKLFETNVILICL